MKLFMATDVIRTVRLIIPRLMQQQQWLQSFRICGKCESKSLLLEGPMGTQPSQNGDCAAENFRVRAW